MKRRDDGFTIVELLIVIVVIAILAAISVVAYNGIQTRTQETVVKSDLVMFHKQVSLFYRTKYYTRTICAFGLLHFRSR